MKPSRTVSGPATCLFRLSEFAAVATMLLLQSADSLGSPGDPAGFSLRNIDERRGKDALMPSNTPTSATSAGPTPALTVVIAAVNGWDMLKSTLDSLDAQPERAKLEVVVVTTDGATLRRLRANLPQVKLVEVGERFSIPKLRFLGIEHARGEIVAILEDHCEVGPSWADAIFAAHQRPSGAVGGPVENGQGGLINWAVYFCEYSAYMAPLNEGESDDLPGNNIA